jgi:restriction endonuclease S subunit
MSASIKDLKIDLNNLDKSNWKTYRFDEIAKNISERVDPNNTDLKVYIGLEHIDSESLHIKRHGTPDDVNGTKLKFYKGDIIFGRRRAYQRKAGIATWDGFCSAHALVLRANPDVIDPELFPFFLHSDLFMNRAIDISVGSLSPTINWGTLKHQEFMLPPQEQQKDLANLLRTTDDVIKKGFLLCDSLDILFKSKAKFISDNHIHEGAYRRIKEICLIKDNMRKPVNSSQRNEMKGDVPYYGANGLVDHLNDFIFDEELVLVAEDGGNFNEFYSKEIAYMVTGKSWVNNHAHVLTAKREFLTTQWLLYSMVHKNILKYITGTTRLKLNKAELENIKIWLPPEKLMKQITDEMNELNSNRKNALEKLNSSRSLKNSLISKVF